MSEVTEPKATAKATKAVATKQETVVYVGPTIPGIGTRNMVLNNGLTEELKKAIEDEPAFASLIVPISGLAVANKSINEKSGATFVFYEKASNYKA